MRKALPIIVVLALAVAAIIAVLYKPPGSPEPDRPTVKTDLAGEAPAPRPWAHQASDIPADPKLRFGQLENSMRYLVMPNPEPPDRVSVRLHIDAGSLMEDDDQQGIAHFLEHMVFNGSKNFTPDELVPIMQRLGIGFGAHINAYTSFNETVYMLDLPNLEENTLELAFTVMRDFADGALLDAGEIDKERGVILSEMTSRDSVGYRMMKQQFSELLPDSLLTHRFPIGTKEMIEGAPRDRFVDFYTRYYTPAQMTFAVVGDIDPDEMVTRIEKAFGTTTNPAKPGPDPELGPINDITGIRPAVFHDREIDSTDVSLLSVRAYRAEPDTREVRTKRMPLSLANAIINRRFQRIAKEENSPITSGSASRDVLFRYVELGSIDVTAADDDWQKALPVLEQEFRRAIEHGFTADELKEARANLINAFEQAAKRAPSRQSSSLATQLVQAINQEAVLSAPATDLEIAREAAGGITPESCHQAFREFWQDAGLHIVLTAKEKPGGAEEKLAGIYQASKATAVEAPAARESVEFAYTDFGAPGTVAGTTELEDLGITQMQLSNGIRVNLKPTDFEAGTVRLSARIGGIGQLTQPADMPAFTFFATAIFEGGGLGRHSVDDLRQVLAGRNVGNTLSIGEEVLQLSGRTTPDDLGLQLRLMCAALTDPGYREEGLRQFRKGVPMILQQLRHTPAGPQAEYDAWLHGDDPRFLPPSDEAALLGYQIASARDWLAPALAKGPIELSIVGDFETGKLMPQLLATFGALPARTPATIPDEARKVEFPAAPGSKNFGFDSKIPQAIAIVVWKTTGMRGNQSEFRRLNILASILSNRLREEIREKLGASYSPSAGVDGSESLDDFGLLLAYSVGKPEDAERLSTIATDLAAKLAGDGATQDELDRAREPALAQITKSLRDNDYWLGTVMERCQEDPERLTLARNRQADYESITLGEINALAKKYFLKENALQVHILPMENMSE